MAEDQLKQLADYLGGFVGMQPQDVRQQQGKEANSQQQSDQQNEYSSNNNQSNGIDTIGKIRDTFGSLFSPRYNTNQVDNARDSNVEFTSGQTARYLNDLEQRRSNTADSDLRRQIYSDNINADRNNAIVNANLARQMALGSQQTLNDQYRNAADRLNNASRDINASLNQSASTIASLFR